VVNCLWIECAESSIAYSFWDKFDRKAATIAKLQNLNLFLLLLFFIQFYVVFTKKLPSLQVTFNRENGKEAKWDPNLEISHISKIYTIYIFLSDFDIWQVFFLWINGLIIFSYLLDNIHWLCFSNRFYLDSYFGFQD